MCIKQFFVKKYIPPKNSIEIVFDNFKPNIKYEKVAIFAGFSSKGLISNIDLYYLNRLKINFDAVILVFDNFIIESELQKIKNLFTAGIFKRHQTYDFGSYKLGYEFLMKKHLIGKISQLLFTNNSVYGPIFNLKHTLNKMNKESDFWGIVQNKKYQTHIQSWFILFNKKIIDSNCIYDFIKNIRKFKLQFSYVKKYEIKFTDYLYKKGFSYNTIVPKEVDSNIFRINHNVMLLPKMLIEQFKIPFVKIKIFTPFFYHIVDQRKETLSLIKNYNLELYDLIISDLKNKNLLPDYFKNILNQ